MYEYWIMSWGISIICLIDALVKWRSYRRDADARLVDIAIRPEFWLRRLKRRKASFAHDTVYNALVSVDADVLETHRELCRLLGKHLNPVYAVRLLKNANRANRLFWADAHIGYARQTIKNETHST